MEDVRSHKGLAAREEDHRHPHVRQVIKEPLSLYSG
jgi:hypothetical protein